MPFVYLIKRTGVTLHPSYLRRDGKFNGGRNEAVQYETRDEAEAKAFSLIAKHPEWLGHLSVVRSASF